MRLSVDHELCVGHAMCALAAPDLFAGAVWVLTPTSVTDLNAFTRLQGVVAELGLELDARGNVAADGNWATSHDRVFVCGDMTRGQSLIVWAFAEGRSCAAGVDRALMGDTALPAPLIPGQLALR